MTDDKKPVCVTCGALNADPRAWDPREPRCPDCQDGRKPRQALLAMGDIK